MGNVNICAHLFVCLWAPSEGEATLDSPPPSSLSPALCVRAVPAACPPPFWGSSRGGARARPARLLAWPAREQPGGLGVPPPPPPR
eukprot:1137685-Pyramimonas_sp.AAC.1